MAMNQRRLSELGAEIRSLRLAQKSRRGAGREEFNPCPLWNITGVVGVSLDRSTHTDFCTVLNVLVKTTRCREDTYQQLGGFDGQIRLLTRKAK